jgi:hypothetical protein
VLTPEERRRLLDDYFALLPLVEKVNSGEEGDFDSSDVVDRQMDLILDYQTGFDQLAISRCPITLEPALVAIDTVDIDGMWWNWSAPLRGMNDLPLTTFAMSGAMELRSPIAPAPFVCRPGPAVPFVIPRILRQAGMKAVISSVEVGPHCGFPIFYFADPLPLDHPRVNDWAASSYFARTSDGFDQYERPDDPIDWDFGLERWIDQGKLLWIAPGDDALELHATTADCPYVDLPGSRAPSLIIDGKLTRLEAGD